MIGKGSTVREGLGLLLGMRKGLGRPVAAENVRSAIEQRYADRQRRFLEFSREVYFGASSNPVQRLLKHSGCEFGDLQRLVQGEGLEGALAQLAGAGVYFRHGEFKGTQPIRRGSLSFHADPGQFRNPRARLQVRAASSGSRGAATPVLIDLEFVRACALSFSASMLARGGDRWRQAIWEVISAGPRFRLLKYHAAGRPAERWFTQLHPGDDSVSPMMRWSDRALRGSARLQGLRFPAPEFAPLDHALPVVRWMRSVLDQGDVPHLLCFPSAGVRLSECALDAGISLEGAQLTTGGEPSTRSRIESIRQCGITVLSRYGSMETGAIGYACLNPQRVDEVHVQQDLVGLIQGQGLDALPDNALLATLLHPRAPFLYFNMSMGDAANINRRDCGCPMCVFPEAIKLSDIHSFDKLTAGGMNFSADILIPILEHTLPSRFGGSSTDYQLLESEGDKGEPQLRILVAPRIGAVDEAELVDVFLASLGSTGVVSRLTEGYWRSNRMVSVERRDPIVTHSAKTLHLRSEV